MKIILRAIAVVYVCLSFSSVLAVEQFRDYYSEPGLHPFKDSLNQHFHEHIDPFSGKLQLSYLDLKVPGNGGLDINITRSYLSREDWVDPYTVTGEGWTMHQGRVVVNNSNADKICTQGNWSANSTDNPSIELPDGSRHTLFFYTDQTTAYLITKNRWKAKCKTAAPFGLIVTAPNGTEYIMDQYGYESNDGGLTALVSYYTTQIKDLYGNTIDISYKDSYGLVRIDTITATSGGVSDGRSVQFTYTGETTGDILLDTISANGQVWQYKYQAIPGDGIPNHQLSGVIRPDGTKWQYTYHPYYSAAGEAGSYSLHTVIYPAGGTITYTYKPVNFDWEATDYNTTVVATKTTGGRNITPGTWTFDYVPASSVNGQGYDKTTVTAPNGRYVYEHYGYKSPDVTNGNVWVIGSLHKKNYFDNNNNLVQSEQNAWDSQIISHEDYTHGRSKIDVETRVPLLIQSVITRDGSTYITDFNGYDIYGNPGQIVETGNSVTRTTNYIYYIDTTNWIVNQVEDETLVGIGTTDRTFNTNGTLKSESKYGVLTQFTYHPTGDLYTVKNARNVTTTYLDYYRGIPRQEIHPVSDTLNMTLDRTVNPTGTVATQTNGRRFTTSFTYDDLNRLETITYPKTGSASVSINYTATDKVLSRGDYQETMAFDGFGQVTAVEHKDTPKNTTITTTKTYDALGQVVFESYPNSVDGTVYQYDTLGRQTRVTHPDASYLGFTYLPNNQVRVRNERGFETLYTYRSYGNPDEKALVRIDSPETISTRIDRNSLGLIETVWQGETGGSGLERRYAYTPEFFLESIDNPETGLTAFGRDAVGNMTSKKVGRSAVTIYTYDYQNRLELTNYADANTPDVTIAYDANGNIKSVSNTSSSRIYDYDENDNLLTETVTISGNTWSINYGYNVLDHLDYIKYPSLRKIDYKPDALDRPSQVAPYVNNVSYYPSGQLQQLVYANGQTTDYTLDNRLRVDHISTSNGSNTVVDLDYAYQLNGNVESILDLLTPEYDIHMTYDGVDRLSTANGIWGAGTILYDKVGNIDTKTIGDYSLTYTYRNNKLYSISGSDSFKPGYDHYGNLTSSAYYEYAYDEAGNLRSGTLLAAVPVGVSADTDFAYDGNSMRVQRTNNGNDIWYVYANNGNLMGEYQLDKTKDKEYFYLGSRMIAAVEGEAPPAADAGVDQTVIRAGVVTLDGSNSSSPDGTITSYSWTQIAGPTVSLTGASSAVATFTAPTVTQNTTLTFDLTVTDSRGLTGKDTVEITVTILDSDLDGLDDDWETLYFTSLSQTASADPDLDGYSNLEEFTLGLDPNVPQPPDAPSGVVINAGLDSATISWPDVSRATQYNIYWSTTPGVTQLTGTKITNVTSSFVHTNLTYDQKYYYVITAENVGAGEGVPSTEKYARIGWATWSDQFSVLDTGADFFIDDVSKVVSPPMVKGKNDHYFIIWSKMTDTWTWVSKYTTKTTSESEIFVSRLLDDNSWSTPINIDPNDGGIFTGAGYWIDDDFTMEISLDSNKSGIAHVVWKKKYLDENGLTLRAKFISRIYDPQTGWQPPRVIYNLEGHPPYDDSNNITIRNHKNAQNIRVDEHGNAVFVWYEFDPYSQPTKRQLKSLTYTKGLGWSKKPIILAEYSSDVSTHTWIDQNNYYLTMDSNGDAMLLWMKMIRYSDGSVEGQLFSKKYSKTNGWETSVRVLPNDFVANRNFSVVDNTNGEVVVLWGNNTSRYLPGSGWQTPVLHADLENIQDIAMNDDGDVVMVSNRNASADNANGAILTKRYSQNIGWQAAESLAPMSAAEQLLLDVDINQNDVIAIVGSTAKSPCGGNCATVDARVFSLTFNENDGWSYEANIGSFPFDSWSWAYTRSYDEALFYFAISSRLTNNDSVIAHLKVHDGLDEAPLMAVLRNSDARIAGNKPVANAGPDRITQHGTLETLDGSASTDADGNIVSYQWKQISGTPVVLTSPESAIATFTVPTLTVYQDKLTFELRVIDDRFNVATDLVTITVRNPNLTDTTPPVVNPPFDIELEATAVLTPASLGTAYALDDVDGSLVPVADNPGPYGEGVHTITWSATDAAGNTGSATQIVTIRDTTPPVLTAPADITVNSNDPIAVDLGVATATDIFTPVTITNDAPALFSSGTTVVTWTATDPNGNSVTATQSVTVLEATPPVTTGTFTPTTSKGSTYYDITLSSNEAGTTYFRLTGGATIISGGTTSADWQVYAGPINIKMDKGGTANFDYYSVDTAGNTEATQTEVLQ